MTINEKAGIIQARTDSSRFPSKVLQIIEGKPLLWHVIERSKKIGIPIIVATTQRDIDDKIIEISNECDVKYYRGSTNDVLDRYYQASKEYKLNEIFRITADSPLIDPHLCSQIVKSFETSEVDYVRPAANTVLGIGMEGFTFEALEKAWLNAKSPAEREHVTPYIINPENGFRILEIQTGYDLGKFHWTVDVPYDLEFIRGIFAELYKNGIFYTDDILELLRKKPYLMKNR
ncbi:MAG: glycosyltransferase family protein [Nitrosotalea sp.]